MDKENQTGNSDNSNQAGTENTTPYRDTNTYVERSGNQEGSTTKEGN